jgi:hypothetical protein
VLDWQRPPHATVADRPTPAVRGAAGTSRERPFVIAHKFAYSMAGMALGAVMICLPAHRIFRIWGRVEISGNSTLVPEFEPSTA